MRLTRADRSLLADWWFTVDRRLLGAFLTLIAIGCILSFAASPAVAVKKGLAPFYFAERHFVFAGLGLVVMLAASALTPRHVRRVALTVFVLAVVLMIWAPLFGPEIKGARRWVYLAGYSFQPSEIGKPALIVLVAWLFSEGARRRDIPAMPLAVGVTVLFAGLLVIQPDIGQTLLIGMVWGTLFVLSGQPLGKALMLVPIGLAGLAAAYFSFDHVRSRVARFLDPGSGDTYQIDRAAQSFTEGGLLGRGPGEGVVKSILPDAHTDFVFAVIGEEYGAVACLALLAIYAFIAFRAFNRAWREPEGSVRLAILGLALLLVAQAAINMGVNVGLLPAKGMTLPFLSAGGSSSLSSSLTAGLMLGLMRRRPDMNTIRTPQLRPTQDGIVVR